MSQSGRVEERARSRRQQAPETAIIAAVVRGAAPADRRGGRRPSNPRPPIAITAKVASAGARPSVVPAPRSRPRRRRGTRPTSRTAPTCARSSRGRRGARRGSRKTSPACRGSKVARGERVGPVLHARSARSAAGQGETRRRVHDRPPSRPPRPFTRWGAGGADGERSDEDPERRPRPRRNQVAMSLSAGG